jgi:hypothetical protein
LEEIPPLIAANGEYIMDVFVLSMVYADPKATSETKGTKNPALWCISTIKSMVNEVNTSAYSSTSVPVHAV